MSAQLFVVATPIGNLEDISFRALRVLRETSAIACEDTRQTSKLLQHYDIRTPLVSYHDHNERERTPELLSRLAAGESIAIVTDAGTPLVSDPGYRLVAAATQAGIPVVPIPGPSAPLAALAASGLPSHAFHFLGFLPPKSGKRQTLLASLATAEDTAICFEAPHRILETLDDIQQTLGPNRPIVVARELTKLHEEFLRGPVSEVRATLAARPALKGEITLLIGPAQRNEANSNPADYAQQVAQLVSEGIPQMDAIKQVARKYNLPKAEVYRVVKGS
jgi:16S rRNA (cytidine1402-2'-O)-methyltransferase